MKKFILLTIILAYSFNARGQSLSSNLSRVAGSYAKNYLQPFVNAIGANLNSGLIYSQSLKNSDVDALHVGISFQSAGTFLPNSERSFSASYDDTVMYNYQGQYYPVQGHATVKNAPTVFGSREPGTANIDVNSSINILGFSYPVQDHRTEKTIGGIYDNNFIPLIIPQLEVGNLYGTSVIIRAFPSIKVGDLGSLNFWGTGIRNNINRFFKSLPVGINVGAYYQQLSLTDSTGSKVSGLNTFVLNLNVNKSISIFTFYGGVQYENSKLNVNYYYQDQNNKDYNFKINFDLTGEDSFRFIAGAAVNLNWFMVNLDLNASKLLTASLGINFLVL